MIDQILNSLNDKQIEAVQKPLEPVLVIAGPGTGKTRVLTARVAWLLEYYQIPAEKILALTFTNKAAAEMQDRLLKLTGQKGKDVYCRTFHSFALDILRKYHKHLELDRFFTVCDQDYQEQLLIRLCTPYIRENVELKAKGILLSFSNYISSGRPLSNFARERWDEYLNHLKKHQMIDFDQIILYCRKLLEEKSDVCDEYRHLYPAILIDEFQDTDPQQYEIIRLLAEKNKNLFVVADDDQSIYSWRGASPENIKRLIEDFSVTHPVFLEINYRNGEKILDNAQRIIARTDRIEPDKSLKVNGEKINHIELKFFLHEKDEVDYILQKLKDWAEQGIPFREMAVIYPFHKIGQGLEQFIIKKEIPYQMAIGRSVLDNPLIKRIILHLKLIRDPDDPVALEELARIELGESLYTLIKHMALEQQARFRKILQKYYVEEDEKLPYDSLLKIRNFIAHIANLVNLKGFYTFNQLLNEISLEITTEMQPYLFRYWRVLQDFYPVEKISGWPLLDEPGKRLFVYHPDPRLAFTGAELLKSVLGRQAEVYAGEKTSQLLQNDDILITLAPIYEVKPDAGIIPIHTLKDEKRRAALSHLFKFLQWYTSKDEHPHFENFVVLDLETTDKDIYTCGIVELAAVKVEGGIVRAELHTLINPQMPISKSAQKVHGISVADVQEAPTIEEFWDEFAAFVGNSILVAHNGYNFDFPLIDRFAKKIAGKKLPNIRIDSLVLARSLFPGESNSIDALMQRFDLKTEQRHRALDDVQVLVKILKELQIRRQNLNRLTSLEMFLDIVALGIFLEDEMQGAEDRLFFVSGGRKLMTAYSKIRREYIRIFNEDSEKLRIKIRQALLEMNPRLISYESNEHLIEKIRELATQYESVSFEEAVSSFLSYLALNSAQDQLENINALSLLTYHAAKGLEFDKVILMGLENKNMPGFHALREDADDDRSVPKKLEEQRRLFYVGMTRAKSELVMTAVKNRGGWEHESSPFLKDLEI
jgi:DNA polymerase III epsilon subunit family exonuclease